MVKIKLIKELYNQRNLNKNHLNINSIILIPNRIIDLTKKSNKTYTISMTDRRNNELNNKIQIEIEK